MRSKPISNWRRSATWDSPWPLLGLADIALYEGRLSDATRLLQQGAAVDLQAGRLDSAAADLAMLGYTQLLRKQKAAALAALEKALANSKDSFDAICGGTDLRGSRRDRKSTQVGGRSGLRITAGSSGVRQTD